MKRVVTAAVAGVALTGLIGIGVAAAATGDGPAGRIADVLAGLVSSGTISQSQADAVAKALEDSRTEAQAERQADRAERRAEVDELLQRTLGMTADEVRAGLESGKTLKEIAGTEEKAKALADGAVSLVKEHTAEAVEEERITQAQADQMVARAQERADAWLAGDDAALGRGLLMLGGVGRGMGHGGMGPGGMGPGGMGHHGGGMGRGWNDDGDTGSSDSSGASAASTTVLPA